MIDVAAEREQVAAAARSWLGTPFRHATRDRIAGIDCANLIVAAFDGVVAVPALPFYSPGWFFHSGTTFLIDGIRRYAADVDRPGVGDIAAFRFGKTISHVGVIVSTEPLIMVHSFIRRGVVSDELYDGSALFRRLECFLSPTRWRDA